jgi:hypothetical protein
MTSGHAVRDVKLFECTLRFTQRHIKLRAFASGVEMLAKIKHEMLKMVPPFIFFFVLLHAVIIIRALMIKGTGVSLNSSVSVVVASLILAKAVLIANMLPFINRYPDRPLIWNAAWKTLIYTIIACIFHFFERLYDYWKETGHLAAANRELLAHINWPQFWAIQILLFLMIGNYCMFAELSRVLGRDVLRAYFLGPRADVPARWQQG